MALKQDPKPTTVALAAEDAEFSRNACEGARANVKKFNLKMAYDKTYPPGTTDFSPIVRALQAANADIVIICSYPLSSVGIVQAVNELNYKPKMIGGAMVGLQATVFKQRLDRAQRHRQLRDLGADREDDGAGRRVLQEIPGGRGEGVDPLGYYLGGWGLRLRLHARQRHRCGEEHRRRQDRRLAAQEHPHKTIMGDWAYGPKGEWTKSGMMQVQYHDIKEGETWKGMNYQTVLTPAELKTGDLIYPYEKAK